jgi:hypothetical protein
MSLAKFPKNVASGLGLKPSDTRLRLAGEVADPARGDFTAQVGTSVVSTRVAENP